MREVTISYDPGEGALLISPDPVPCSVDVDKEVKFKSGLGVSDWRVVFGTYAPLFPSKVASPTHDTLKLKKNRPEDLGHWKYVVVAMTDDGSLVDKDPEMIVEG